MARRIFLTIALLVVFLSPAIVQAVEFFPLVPCGISNTSLPAEKQVPCTPCHIFQGIQNFTNLILLGITGPIALFMIVVAGGMILLYGADPSKQVQGKTILKNTLYGVAIILIAWLAVDFLIKTIWTNNPNDAWYQFSCPDFLQKEDVVLSSPSPATNRAPALQQASILSCDRTELAATYHVPLIPTPAPDLKALMDCIERDAIVSKVIDTNQRFTFELQNPLCNLTRGKPVCGGSCQHCGANGCQGSCHYGGRSGTQGAEAVDYNFSQQYVTTPLVYNIATRVPVAGGITSEECKGGKCRKVGNEYDLFDEIYRSIVKNNCDYKLLNFEISHTHISAPACDMDTKGISGKRAPTIP